MKGEKKITVKEFINQIYVALIIIFNTGIVLRILKTLMEGMSEDDTGTPKNRIKNQLKALIVVNTVYGIINAIKNYFT